MHSVRGRQPLRAKLQGELVIMTSPCRNPESGLCPVLFAASATSCGSLNAWQRAGGSLAYTRNTRTHAGATLQPNQLTVDACRRMFADLDGGFRGIAVMLGGPAAQPASPAAHAVDLAGQPVASAAGHRRQDGWVPGDAQHNCDGMHIGQPLRGSAADTAIGCCIVKSAADGTNNSPDTTAAARPAADEKKAAAAQPAGAACHPESRRLAALRPTVAVAVAAGQGAAQALALAGALALQVTA